MKTRLLRISLVLLLLLILVGGYVGFQIATMLSKENLAETVEIPGCRMIPGAMGSEDFHYISEARALVISSFDRRAVENTTGQLCWLDLSVPVERQAITPIQSNYPKRFTPHGLSYQRTSETSGNLFVISHRLQDGMRHTIEVFSLNFGGKTPELKHERTLVDQLLLSPNDLTALPDGTLFIANDSQDLGGGLIAQIIDGLLKRCRAPLVYYDGQKFHDMNANMILSAGITYVKRGNKEVLYRSDYMRKNVQQLIITRNQQGFPSVEPVKTISLNSGPDNFSVDEIGNVYVAAHYSTGLLLATKADPEVVAPTQVFRIAPDDSVSLIYADRGNEISAGSVAQVIGDRFFIGQIYEDGLLSCPIPNGL